MRFGFEQAGLTEIVALAVPENTASLQVMKKLGMTLAGTTRLFGLNLVQYRLTNPAQAR